MKETRRAALKMLGTIGATCAFPFAGDELYGQHVHEAAAQGPSARAGAPAFFTPEEYRVLTRLTDVIIPPTDTPGASAAGVPEYIDRVVSLNATHQPLVREGLAWIRMEARRRFSRDYLALSDAQHAAILRPLSDELDRRHRAAQRARYRPGARGKRTYFVAITDRDQPARPAVAVPPRDAGLAQPVRFFRLVKNLTADGYYTSRAGLLEELGYKGNTALGRFPSCTVPEH